MKFRTGAAALLAAAATVIPATAASATPDQQTVEIGAAATCSGSVGDLEAFVELYENSSFPDSLNVFISTPEGFLATDRNAPEPTDIFSNGTISGTSPLRLRREDVEGTTPAGTATVSGSYSATGGPVRVHEVRRDDGFVIVMTGTNTPLSAQVDVTYDGTTIPLTCDTAFAFDLRTLRQPIGNG